MTTARSAMQEVAPKLAEIAADTRFGDVWERPGPSTRDRSLITVTTLIALYRTGQLPGHINRALDNGVTKDEIAELVTHVGLYAGVPRAAQAAGIIRDVYNSR